MTKNIEFIHIKPKVYLHRRRRSCMHMIRYLFIIITYKVQRGNDTFLTLYVYLYRVHLMANGVGAEHMQFPI